MRRHLQLSNFSYEYPEDEEQWRLDIGGNGRRQPLKGGHASAGQDINTWYAAAQKQEVPKLRETVFSDGPLLEDHNFKIN